MNADHRHPVAALTLIEVVLAVAILSIGAVVLIAATSRCLAVVRVLRNVQTARSVLDYLEREAPLTDKVDVNELEINGDSTPFPGFRVTRTVEPLDDTEELLEDLFVVHTRIAWSERGTASFEDITQYLFSTNHLR